MSDIMNTDKLWKECQEGTELVAKMMIQETLGWFAGSKNSVFIRAAIRAALEERMPNLKFSVERVTRLEKVREYFYPYPYISYEILVITGRNVLGVTVVEYDSWHDGIGIFRRIC